MKDMDLLIEVQFDHQEGIMVAEPFTCTQREMLLSRSRSGWSPKQENYLHETLHVGKSNIILISILLVHHKPNLLNGKTTEVRQLSRTIPYHNFS